VRPTAVKTGDRVTVDASESASATYVSFDFQGDGSYDRSDETDFQEDTSYDVPGTYRPVVRAHNSGKTDTTECPPVTVTEPSSPTTSLSATPTSPEPGEQVTLDASGSTDPDGDIEAYQWDVDDDGAVDQTTNTPRTTETYTTTGTRQVTVTVQDATGKTDEATVTVDVRRPISPPVVTCRVEPTSVHVGEPVTIDASDTDGTVFVQFDVDGDGTYERSDETDFSIETDYQSVGRYAVSARARNDGGETTADCGEVTVTENRPPTANFTVDAQPATVDRSVTFDASESSDPDGRIVAYRWDFDADGVVDETTNDSTVTHDYSVASSQVPSLEVVDDDNATARTSLDLRVVAPNPVSECSVTPAVVGPNETVTIDASGSENAVFAEFDVDGDGTYERSSETNFTIETEYGSTGTYTPVVRVTNAAGVTATESCGDIEVDIGTTTPEDEGESLPILPIIGGIGLLALGLGAWAMFGGTSGTGGDASPPKPKPKPKPRAGTPPTPFRYETGTFTVPATSGTAAVTGLGFEPDVVVLTGTNGARVDDALDRTAGWSRGVAVRTEPAADDEAGTATATDGGETTATRIDQHAVSVATDARTTDRAVASTTDDAALDVIHHGSGVPGRLRLRVAATNDDGFSVDATVPSPDAGGAKVLYTAFRTGDDVDVSAGHFRTPTEPGTQVVDLGLDADYVSLLATSAVDAVGATYTTDRSVGVSRGAVTATEDETVRQPDQTVQGEAAWPGPGSATAAYGGTDGAFSLLYQDGPRVAGRTRATATSLGDHLGLRYDRAYSGPHKLGSTAFHPVSYLAMRAGGFAPSVGTFRLPRPGEPVTVDCGCRPGMLELSPLPVTGRGEETVGAGQAFGSSDGTVIERDGRLAQYVLHEAAPPAEPAVAETAMRAQAAPATDGGAELGSRLREDGVAALSLSMTDGSPTGRDELRVERFIESGFVASTAAVDTDARPAADQRPLVFYRAWPAVSPDETDETDEDLPDATAPTDRRDGATDSASTTTTATSDTETDQ
jgi:hypothetical protein